MPLTNTTTVPPEDAGPVMNAQNTIKMIVIGDRPTLVAKVDSLSLNPPIAIRKVIWYKNDLPAAIRTKYNIKGSTQAFVLNINNVLKDEISVFEQIDNVRLSLAYVNGAKV